MKHHDVGLDALITASRAKGSRTWAFVSLSGGTLARITKLLDHVPDDWLWHHPKGYTSLLSLW
jgi:hypothetical protein